MEIFNNLDGFEVSTEVRDGPFTVKPTVYRDERGSFAELWRESVFDDGQWRSQDNV